MTIEDELKTEKLDEPPAPVRANDLYGRALQWARWRIRKKNLQARQAGLTDASGNVIRVPLDDPSNQL